MEMIVATAFISPRTTNTKAIMDVTSDACMGSLSLMFAAPNQWFICFDGKDLSRASAWSVRGATITEPRADEMVEAANPSGIIIAPPIAISVSYTHLRAHETDSY